MLDLPHAAPCMPNPTDLPHAEPIPPRSCSLLRKAVAWDRQSLLSLPSSISQGGCGGRASTRLDMDLEARLTEAAALLSAYAGEEARAALRIPVTSRSLWGSVADEPSSLPTVAAPTAGACIATVAGPTAGACIGELRPSSAAVREMSAVTSAVPWPIHQSSNGVQACRGLDAERVADDSSDGEELDTISTGDERETDPMRWATAAVRLHAPSMCAALLTPVCCAADWPCPWRRFVFPWTLLACTGAPAHTSHALHLQCTPPFTHLLFTPLIHTSRSSAPVSFPCCDLNFDLNFVTSRVCSRPGFLR